MNISLFGAAFLIGSIPFGILIAKLFKVSDLTAQGSGNMGATNVSRIVGFWPAGLLTLLLDLGKGALGVFAVSLPAIQHLHEGASLAPSLTRPWAVGAFAVAGHCYSPWVKFRGGKGVATGLGVLLMLAPLPACLGMAAFLLVFLETKTGSLASLSGLFTVGVSYLIFNPPDERLWFMCFILALILFRHQSNLTALLEGRENQFQLK